MTEHADLNDPATWPLIEGDDVGEPIGYDGYGAPIYPWQQTDIRPPMNAIDETVRAMTIPTAELPEAFRAQHDINRIHKALEHDPWYGWEQVGYTIEDSPVEWRDSTPRTIEGVRAALGSLADHTLLPARQIWITGLEEPEEPFFKRLVEEHVEAAAKAQDDAIRHRLSTWAFEKIELTFDLEEVDFDVLELLVGKDIRPPFCEQQIPSRGQE